ncbi:hypothetical protein PA598K_06250 [Paenibacillus sp. 598K]|uniref:hypothetical protein n=1 Tax=Paenibacillus sp. 598K TaxID=1117987 RepID=UPI000FFA978A|nr:hypothetical protein [Paenibacillus sp. 598K]GBF77688.1 hypothetical protein PA598K_06250 [Paenibacillus sp. 598K]
MRSNRKWTWLFVEIAILSCLLVGDIMNNQSPESSITEVKTSINTTVNSAQKVKAHALIQTYPFDEALQQADLVSEIVITNHAGEIDEPSTKTIFSAEIVKSYKGGLEAGETIDVLQEGNSKVEFNGTRFFQVGEKYVLILKKATGFSERTYWILGGESGVYEVVDDSTIIKWAKVEDNQIRNKEQFEQLITAQVAEKKPLGTQR